MSNIIKANFGPNKGNSGYLMDNRDKGVDGVFCGELGAMKLADGSGW